MFSFSDSRLAVSNTPVSIQRQYQLCDTTAGAGPTSCPLELVVEALGI